MRKCSEALTNTSCACGAPMGMKVPHVPSPPFAKSCYIVIASNRRACPEPHRRARGNPSEFRHICVLENSPYALHRSKGRCLLRPLRTGVASAM